ncbi:T9SS type A sorting domain-containing protein [Carboxylicivirga linearis]|uniref:T9SS type A sorting domain-containing protein n=1 Tax=Carboxylicivirga linearis TaxID=1628157 RepID=A0ABS5JZP3_9BACT|nr:T9SS type A sorting domain-containing protein [Carboxylicivirga linearis]MBS2100372.1 T9SS type A sorting domain-containing protein [Carboxylicivirga linearis]
MKRFTSLLLGACLFSFSTIAQLAPPTSDVSAPVTKTGTVSSVANYGTGLVFVSNTSTNDVISITTDGSSFTDVESLEAGTVSGINGWSDGNIAFYLGDDASGVGLRKLEDGTVTLIDGPNPVNPTQKPGSGVLRYTGDNGPLYFYNYYDSFDAINGDVYLPSYTDGTSPSTANYTSYDASTRNSLPLGAMFNGNLYLAGATGGFFPTPKLYAFDGTNLTEVHSGTELSFYNFTSTFKHLFFLQGLYGDFSDAALYTLNTDGVVERLTINGMDVMVDDSMPLQVLNNKVYAVVEDKLTSIAWDMDFATMSWGWKIETYHVNAQDESDNISDFVISGDNIYVLAAKTEGEAELYALNPNEGEYVSAMPDNIAPSDAFHSLTAIEGGVAFLGNNGTSDVVYVSDGNDGNTKQLLFEGQPTLSINEMYSAGGKVYMFAENGTDTDIYQYTPSFSTQTVTVTIIDEATSNPIQYANVVFNTGLKRYSGTTDENGQVVIENVPNGYLNVTVDASGAGSYVAINEEYYVGAYTTEVTYSLLTGKQFMITVLDSNTSSEVYDVTLTFEDQTDGSTYSTTIVYNSMTWMVIGNTPILPMGTYTVTIVCDGYDTYTETDFLVDDNISSVSFTISEISTGMDKTKDNGISIYPNPASDVINITTDKEIVSVEVIAINGAKVKQFTRGNITQINISDLAKGIYIVRTTDVNGAKAWTKVNKL